MIILLVFALASLPSPVITPSVVIMQRECDNQDAITIKCFDMHSNEIPRGGTIFRHESLLVTLTQVERACKFTIPHYLVLIIPPSDGTFPTGKWASNALTINESGKRELHPYTIEDTGEVTLKVFPANITKKQIANPVTCEFNVDYAKPEVTLVGGSEEDYAINKESTIKSQAKNLNNKDHSSENLTFSWKCSVVQGSESGFCNQPSMDKFNEKNALVVPASAAVKENSFSITLEVGLRNVPNYETTVTQKILFTQRKAEGKLEILCIINCIPVAETPLPTLPVILRATCVNCDLKSNVYLFWTIKDSKGTESVDYSKLKSQKGYEFYLQPNALKDKEKYTIKVRVEGPDGPVGGMSEKFKIFPNLPPPVKGCVIDPSKGVAFQTGFQINCIYFPGKLTSEIFAVKNGKTTLITKTKHLMEDQSFMLPADVSVLLNVTDDRTGFTQSIDIDVEVKECMNLKETKSDSEINKAVGDKINDVLDFINDGHPSLALQGIAAIVSEYSNLPPDKKNVTKGLDKIAMKTIKKVKLESPERAQQVVDILAHIAGRYEASDPEISVQTTKICAKASKVLLNQAKYAKNPGLIRIQVTNSMKSLSSCSQAGLKENKKAVETATVSVVLTTTEFPMMPAKHLPENYADYTDDENAADNKAQFEQASKSMSNICFSNARMMAFTMVPEEDPLITIQDSMTIAAARMYCDEIAYRRLEAAGISVKPSAQCSNQKVPIVDILMCVTQKNPYWYIDNIPLITPVVYIKFTGSEPQRSAMDFDFFRDKQSLDPFKITLASNDTEKVQLKIHEAPLSNKSISQMDESSFYESISTHRIFVIKYRRFTVSFQNMSDSESYDITITNFEKPSYTYFKVNYQTITVNNHIVDINQTQSYDSFWYLSVLRNTKMEYLSGSAEKKYVFSVSTTGCYMWNDSVRHWEYACNAAGGRSRSKNIICYCKYGHIFTGYITDNKVTLVENFPIEFNLEFKFCWILYITIMVTFFLFTLVLFLTSFELPGDILDRVFFVGDVPSFYQYPYMVVIKTGNKKHAGTTSNITIKLRGLKGVSLEHVLNYPDPDLIMVQRDAETAFVLATERSLGDLKEIEIWFDCIGNNTKWYCSKIEIHDIQDSKSWLFEVEKWFDVLQQDHNKFIFTPTQKEPVNQEEEKEERLVIRAIKSVLGKWDNEVNMWNLFVPDPLLTRKERASLVFSSIVLTYLITMVMYSIPTFSETDSIAEHTFGFHVTLAWTPIVSSTIAFFVHFPLVYFIKRGKISVSKARRVFGPTWINMSLLSTVCWSMVVSIASAATTLLIICGFWIPQDTSLLWLLSVFLATSFNILVLQNISRYLYEYFIKFSTQVQTFATVTKRIIQHIELQRIWIYKRFGLLSLRPYLKHLYFNLDPISIKERFKWEETKLKIREIIEDLIMITLYVALLYIVLMLDRESQAIYSHKEVKKLVQGKVIGKSMSTKSISNIEDFTSDVLLPSIQSVQWYGKFIQDNPGITKDFSNKYLGIIRLRQHRTKEITCKLPKEFKHLNMICRPDFNVLKESESFSRGWGPTTDVSNISTERMGNIWKYTDSSVAGTSRYFGEYGIYPGGGYVAPLGRTIKNSLINLNYLKKHKWLDFRTRALFIEFLTYNPNVNLFNSVSIIFEINSAGHLAKKINIQTRKFLMLDKDRVFTKNVTSSCFVIAILALFVRIVFKMVKKKWTYFYDVWAIFDIVIVLLSGLSIFLYYSRLGRISVYISEVSAAKNNEFVNYFHLFAADNTLTSLTATLVFVATLRLWKLLRFMVIIKTMEKTLKDSWAPLLVCLVYQMVYMVAFSAVAILFLGSISEDFRDFRSSFTTLHLLSLNLYGDFETDVLHQHPLGIPFYCLYMLFSIFFFTVYVAIVSLYYADAKDYFADEPRTLQKFVHEKWVYYKTLMMVRAKKLRGGEDYASDDLIIKPKSGDRYENCFTIARSRLDGMALVTMCVLRNMEEQNPLTDKDFELMSKTIKALFGEESSEKEIFFASGDSHHIRFVDDRRIRMIADICERLVRECQNIPRVSRKQGKPLVEQRMERIDALVDNVKTINSILNNIQINFK